MIPDPPLPPECSRVVATSAQIATRVAELGARLAHDGGGDTVRLVTVLRGGVFFLADLCRAMECDVRLDFMAVAQYVPGQGGAVRVTKDLDDDIEGARVVLVEDIVDTGLTVNYVLGLLNARGAASVEVCALFDKPARRIADVPLAYRGFELSDRFLVGYGLDLGGRYRNLPYVAELRDEAVYG
ncbi:MAG: hypoxanthine phosphoribosyltransferase [Coriobacteriia bacterium]|nr:hypoxanthine phosphoribosyltransferase [Coriobacteriia bacterium]